MRDPWFIVVDVGQAEQIAKSFGKWLCKVLWCFQWNQKLALRSGVNLGVVRTKQRMSRVSFESWEKCFISMSIQTLWISERKRETVRRSLEGASVRGSWWFSNDDDIHRINVTKVCWVTLRALTAYPRSVDIYFVSLMSHWRVLMGLPGQPRVKAKIPQPLDEGHPSCLSTAG